MVSPSKGALSYSLPPDIAPKSPWGPSISFARTYLSQYAPGGGAAAYRKALGDRWTHTYASWLDYNGVPSPPQVVLHLSSGKDTLLKRSATTGGYDTYQTFQPGFHVQYLRKNQSTNIWELKLLTGETLVYNSSGKLTEIWDTLTTPNKVLLTYDGSGMLSTVTDATTKRRLLFAYTSSLMTSVAFQLLTTMPSTWTTQHTTTYGYTSSNLTTVTIGGQLAQTNVYTSNYLTRIDDGDSKQLVAFTYDGTTAGKLDRVDTPRGSVGFEYNSSRASCSGTTIAYFNLGNSSSCSVDSDCGSGFLCGGKTGAGSTGKCYRAGRCLTVSSPSEDVVTTVTSLGPPSETCSGACATVGAYVWTTGTSTLDMKATQDGVGSSSFTTRVFNANGLPTQIHYGDADNDPTNTNDARIEYIEYWDTVSAGVPYFPGRVKVRRHKSDLHTNASSCNSSPGSDGCAHTTFNLNLNGQTTTMVRDGSTLNSSNVAVTQTQTTTYTYTALGQLESIDGPLAYPSYNDYTYIDYIVGSTNPVHEGFINFIQRSRDASNVLNTVYWDRDFRGNTTSIQEPDLSYTCYTFSTNRGVMTQMREAMAGQSSCSTTNSADLTTSYTYDSSLRLTQVTKPDNSCVFNEYDSQGRLNIIKRRDDCTTGSSGDRQVFTYDLDGLLIKIESQDPSNTVTYRREMTYADGRQLEHIINPMATSTYVNMVYDQGGLVVEVDGEQSGGNPLSKTTYTLDVDRRVTTVTKYKTTGTSDAYTLQYGWGGSQKNVTDPDSKATESKRDDFGRVVRITSPDLTGGPTLFLFDEGGNRITKIDSYNGGGAGQRQHDYTFDSLGSPLTDNDPEACTATEVQRSYDTPTVACPAGVTCSNTRGRLAWVKATLACVGGKALNQSTWFAYDPAGRLIREYIKDDAATPRTSDHVYTWTKDSQLASVTLPSGAIHNWAFYAAATGTNSDTDRVEKLTRATTGAPTPVQVTHGSTWQPFGPLAKYDQENTYTSGTTVGIRTRIVRDLSYDITRIIMETATSSVTFARVDPVRDVHHRVIQRDFDNALGMVDSYYLYDMQDRLLCETTSSVSSCPTSGSNIKNSHAASPPFTNAGDWTKLLRPIPGSTGLTHDFNGAGYGTSHQIVTVNQSDGSPTLGTTSLHYDAYGNRDYDVNTGLAHDRRDYTYDSRGNVINIRGQYKTGGSWHYYDVLSMYDSRNRRVFKSFYDETTTVTSSWFMFYDVKDRLTEIRYTPNTASATTYSNFEIFWIGEHPTAQWQIDYPSTTTSKRYIATNEMDRPIYMQTWPTSGNPTTVWAINESAWGVDAVLAGSGVFQPLLFAGQHNDPETMAWRDDGTTVHRNGLAYGGLREYDPWVGAYLQIDPMVPWTWSSYGYATNERSIFTQESADGLDVAPISTSHSATTEVEFWEVAYAGDIECDFPLEANVTEVGGTTQTSQPHTSLDRLQPGCHGNPYNTVIFECVAECGGFVWANTPCYAQGVFCNGVPLPDPARIPPSVYEYQLKAMQYGEFGTRLMTVNDGSTLCRITECGFEDTWSTCLNLTCN